MAKGAHLITHGLSKVPEYRIWAAMRERCMSPSCGQYPRYGGRGIKVCPQWALFDQFYADMGPRPSAKHSIERKDVNGDYSPENCVWATRTEQARNRTDTKVLTYNGVAKPLAQWAEERGIKRSTLAQRIYAYKWPVDRALNFA